MGHKRGPGHAPIVVDLEAYKQEAYKQAAKHIKIEASDGPLNAAPNPFKGKGPPKEVAQQGFLRHMPKKLVPKNCADDNTDSALCLGIAGASLGILGLVSAAVFLSSESWLPALLHELDDENTDDEKTVDEVTDRGATDRGVTDDEMDKLFEKRF